MNEQVLLTVEEVARRLRIAPATVYELVSDRLIACYRVGSRKGAIRFTEEQIQKYLAECLITDGKVVVAKKPRPKKLKHLELD